LATRQGPWRRTVSRHDHRPAFEHAMGHDITLIEHGRQHRSDRMAWPNDRPGEVARGLEHRFAGDLVLAIDPIRVHRRRLLRDEIVARRLLVNGGRGYEYVLTRAAREGVDVPRHLLGPEDNELADDIKAALPKSAVGPGVVHLPGDRGDANG